MDAETGVRSPRSRLSRSQSSGHPTTKEVSHVRPLYAVYEILRRLLTSVPSALQALAGMLSSWFSRRFFSGWCAAMQLAPAHVVSSLARA
jgi:hypothetical protein